MYWTMRNGKQIKISDMTTEHIINCLNMLERRGCTTEKYDHLLYELKKRGVPFLPAYIPDSEVINKYTFEEY